MKRDILIIDDETILLHSLKAALEDIASNIFTAGSGANGIEIFKDKSDSIGCVICDVNMPQMQGLQVIKSIREIDKEIPFIFFTGFGSRELMSEAIRYGAYDFVEKPKVEELIAAIYSVFHNTPKNEDNEYMTLYNELLRQEKES